MPGMRVERTSRAVTRRRVCSCDFRRPPSRAVAGTLDLSEDFGVARIVSSVNVSDPVWIPCSVFQMLATYALYAVVLFVFGPVDF